MNCQSPMCWEKAGPPHHIVLKSQGGKDVLENKIALCYTCHEFAHGRGNLKVNGKRVSGREFILGVLEWHRKDAGFMWEDSYQWHLSRRNL